MDIVVESVSKKNYSQIVRKEYSNQFIFYITIEQDIFEFGAKASSMASTVGFFFGYRLVKSTTLVTKAIGLE